MLKIGAAGGGSEEQQHFIVHSRGTFIGGLVPFLRKDPFVFGVLIA